MTGIIQALADSTGHTVERRMVDLSEPTRQPGEYPIKLRLHQNVAASITVMALGEGQTPEMLAAVAEEENSTNLIDEVIPETVQESETSATNENDVDPD